MGHNSFIYLDDGFSSRPNKFSATAASLIQRKELSSSGLLSNEEKSHWSPMQIGEWLEIRITDIEEKSPEKSIYVICRLGGPYSEKLWPRSWKCCPKPHFKAEVTVFHYTDRP